MVRSQLKKLEKEHPNKSRVEPWPTSTSASLITLHRGCMGWARAWGTGGLEQVSIEWLWVHRSGFSLLHFFLFLKLGSQSNCIRLFGST